MSLPPGKASAAQGHKASKQRTQLEVFLLCLCLQRANFNKHATFFGCIEFGWTSGGRSLLQGVRSEGREKHMQVPEAWVGEVGLGWSECGPCFLELKGKILALESGKAIGTPCCALCQPSGASGRRAAGISPRIFPVFAAGEGS